MDIIEKDSINYIYCNISNEVENTYYTMSIQSAEYEVNATLAAPVGVNNRYVKFTLVFVSQSRSWGTKTNANLNLAEQLLGGFKIQTLNAAGTGANTTALAVDDGALTGAAQNRVIILGAVSPEAITGNKVVTFPLLTETFYFIKNSTSGAYTVQLKAASGSGATVTFGATDKGYKAIYLDGVATNTGVIEIPLSTAGTVTETGTQTLTNKTLTSPKIGTSILDTSGNELFKLTATGSAVNELTYANAARS